MKIQIICHNTELGLPQKSMRWNYIPYYLEQMGHKVDHILKQDWTSFYYRYLKFKPDVIITAGAISFIPSLFKQFGLIKKPIIYDWTDDITDINGLQHGITKMALYEYFSVSRANYITTPSIFKQERCKQWNIPCEYIPHGVNENFDNIKPNIYEDSKLKVFYGGELSKRKNVDKIIEAVKDKNCNLYLLGKIEDIKPLYYDNIFWLGSLPWNEYIRHLKSCDIAILSADDDCTLKMFEAIKAEKTILGYRGRLNYVLEHMNNAYLTDNLGKGLEILINDEQLRNKLSNGVKQIKVNTWKNISRQYSDYLKSIIEVK